MVEPSRCQKCGGAFEYHEDGAGFVAVCPKCDLGFNDSEGK